jgi:hypothetical protein
MDTFLLDAGNVFIFISGFLMLKTAYKDRNVLKGYNLTGTLLITIGLSLMLSYFVQQGFWLSFFLTLPNYSYWVIVSASILSKRGMGSGLS